MSNDERLRWTSEMELFLQKNYREMTSKALGQVMNKKEQAIAQRLSLLGLRRDVDPHKVNQCLTAKYQTMSDIELSKHCNISATAVRHRLDMLGLKRNKVPKESRIESNSSGIEAVDFGEWIKVREAAERFGKTIRTIYELCDYRPGKGNVETKLLGNLTQPRLVNKKQLLQEAQSRGWI